MSTELAAKGICVDSRGFRTGVDKRFWLSRKRECQYIQMRQHGAGRKTFIKWHTMQKFMDPVKDKDHISIIYVVLLYD